jgi:hypothetical protein
VALHRDFRGGGSHHICHLARCVEGVLDPRLVRLPASGRISRASGVVRTHQSEPPWSARPDQPRSRLFRIALDGGGCLRCTGSAACVVRAPALVILLRRRAVLGYGPADLSGHLDAPDGVGHPGCHLAGKITGSAGMGALGGGVHDGALLDRANLVGSQRGGRTAA